jgi:hypothetical protein
MFHYVLYHLCDRFAAVDFCEFVINEYQIYCCVEKKMKKGFGKSFVQF